jgi:hypothetical protein
MNEKKFLMAIVLKIKPSRFSKIARSILPISSAFSISKTCRRTAPLPEGNSIYTSFDGVWRAATEQYLNKIGCLGNIGE